MSNKVVITAQQTPEYIAAQKIQTAKRRRIAFFRHTTVIALEQLQAPLILVRWWFE